MARPGPAHQIFKRLGPAWPGPDERPMASPANYGYFLLLIGGAGSRYLEVYTKAILYKKVQ